MALNVWLMLNLQYNPDIIKYRGSYFKIYCINPKLKFKYYSNCNIVRIVTFCFRSSSFQKLKFVQITDKHDLILATTSDLFTFGESILDVNFGLPLNVEDYFNLKQYSYFNLFKCFALHLISEISKRA